jgi:uncharacterized protein (TIGR00661 family)
MSLRILYGIQGVGNGHIARGRVLVPKLKALDADVTCLFSGRTRNELPKDEFFNPYMAYNGISMVTENGKVNNLKTVFNKNAKDLPGELTHVSLTLQLPSQNLFDILVTDYEPLLAHAARLSRRPAIGVGNMYAFIHDIPGMKKLHPMRAIINGYAPARHNLPLHWDHFDQPILPPMVNVPKAAEIIDPRKIVVYMNFEKLESLKELFAEFKDYEFYIYSSQVKEDSDQGNLRLRKLSYDGFRADLADCAGAIANAGFEFTSELLGMGKKVLVKPVEKQPEQKSNGRVLEALGYGSAMESLDRKAIKKWLKENKAVRLPWPDVGAAIAQWIVDGAKPDRIEPMVKKLWKDTKASEVKLAL